MPGEAAAAPGQAVRHSGVELHGSEDLPKLFGCDAARPQQARHSARQAQRRSIPRRPRTDRRRAPLRFFRPCPRAPVRPWWDSAFPKGWPGAASGRPAARMTACAAGCEGQRDRHCGKPRADLVRNEAGFFEDDGQRPRPKRSASRCAASGISLTRGVQSASRAMCTMRGLSCGRPLASIRATAGPFSASAARPTPSQWGWPPAPSRRSCAARATAPSSSAAFKYSVCIAISPSGQAFSSPPSKKEAGAVPVRRLGSALHAVFQLGGSVGRDEGVDDLVDVAVEQIVEAVKGSGRCGDRSVCPGDSCRYGCAPSGRRCPPGTALGRHGLLLSRLASRRRDLSTFSALSLVLVLAALILALDPPCRSADG